MKCDVASRSLSRKCIIFPFTHIIVFFVSYDLSKTLQSFVLSPMSYQNISNTFHRISIIILHTVIWSANEIYYCEHGSKLLSKLAKDLSRSIFFQKMRDDISQKCSDSFHGEMFFPLRQSHLMKSCVWLYLRLLKYPTCLHRKCICFYVVSEMFLVRIVIIRSLLNWPAYLTVNLSSEKLIFRIIFFFF